MRMLVQAIISSSAFHGYEASTVEPANLAELLNIDVDSERMEKIAKLFKSLQHKLGETHTEARQLLELLKYE